MSTRAIYSFETEHGGTVHVYKHSDGYPTGAADALKAAAMFAWPRPRYEGDDFAAAFVAANKMPYYLQPGMQELWYRLQRERPASPDAFECEITQTFKVPAFGKAPTGQGGGVRLIPQGLQPAQFAGDAAYRYVISVDGMKVTAFACDYWDSNDKETFLFSTSLAGFARRAAAFKKAQNKPAKAKAKAAGKLVA